LAFVLAEAALGALLVLKELVAQDTSVARAIVVALHLVNTLGLLGAGALTAHFASGGARAGRRFLSPAGIPWMVSLVGFVVVGMTGAVTALGDTLFPVDPATSEGLWARLRADLSAAEHFLVRLRVVHPLIAITVGAGLIWLLHPGRSYAARGSVKVAFALLLAQLAGGVVNIGLGAPGWMQLVHLGVGDLLWAAMLIAAHDVLGERATN
jgi:heme A synthase